MTTISVPNDAGAALLGDLPPDTEVLVWDGHAAPPDGAERIEFLVGLYQAPPPSAEALAALPALRAVQLLSAGVEPWLPVMPDGVQLCNGRGIHGAGTAEIALAGMMALLRELPGFLDAQRAQDWAPKQTDSIENRRVLMVGAGDIGAKVAGVCRTLGAPVTVVGRSERDGVRAQADLPALLPEHDVVVLAVPHTPDTHHLVDAAFLAAMPDGAMLVNVARGPVVDTDALVAELTAGRLQAFLDVTDPEPLPDGHPLWTAPNVLITPHVGGDTRNWERIGYRLVTEQVTRFVNGEQLANLVTDGF